MIISNWRGVLDVTSVLRDGKIRRNAFIEWKIGTIFHEAEGPHIVVKCVPVADRIGEWDIHLRPASSGDILASEIMFT